MSHTGTEESLNTEILKGAAEFLRQLLSHEIRQLKGRCTSRIYLGFLISACAAASLATGTRKGEQET